MKKLIWIMLVCLPMLVVAQESSKTLPSQNILKINPTSQLVIKSYGRFSTGEKSVVQQVTLQATIKNLQPVDKSASNLTSSAPLEIGGVIIDKRKGYFFELTNGTDYFKAIPLGISKTTLFDGELLDVTLSFQFSLDVDINQLKLRYKDPKDGGFASEWLPLGEFFKTAPEDTKVMGRYAYFTVIDYTLIPQEKKNTLLLHVLLANNRGYNSYFRSGFIPDMNLDIYNGKCLPIEYNGVIYNALGTPTKRTKLLPGDVLDLKIEYALPPDADMSKIKIQYIDKQKYIEPSDWLDLGSYIEKVPQKAIATLKKKS